LLKLASKRLGSPEGREAARAALDAGWSLPQRRAQILRAAARCGDSRMAPQFVTALDDADASVAEAARDTLKRLKIDPQKIRATPASRKIGELAPEAVVAAVEQARGDAIRGEQLFTQVGCNACHTVKTDEPLKGPFLGSIANVY